MGRVGVLQDGSKVSIQYVFRYRDLAVIFSTIVSTVIRIQSSDAMTNVPSLYECVCKSLSVTQGTTGANSAS